MFALVVFRTPALPKAWTRKTASIPKVIQTRLKSHHCLFRRSRPVARGSIFLHNISQNARRISPRRIFFLHELLQKTALKPLTSDFEKAYISAAMGGGITEKQLKFQGLIGLKMFNIDGRALINKSASPTKHRLWFWKKSSSWELATVVDYAALVFVSKRTCRTFKHRLVRPNRNRTLVTAAQYGSNQLWQFSPQVLQPVHLFIEDKE